MEIRAAIEQDASALAAFFPILYSETDFLLFTDGEYRLSVEQQRNIIARTSAAGGLIALGIEGGIAGIVHANRNSYVRTRHIATLALGVLDAYVGRGLGGELLAFSRNWALEEGVTRLELSVDVRNERAIRLYERNGFQVEGTRRAARRVGDTLLDELYMAMILPPRIAPAVNIGHKNDCSTNG